MRISVLILTALLFAACGTDTPDPTPGASQRATTRIVEVTNYPLEYVAHRLAGPGIEVRFRAAEAPDPAYWTPTTEDVLGMQEADLVLINGASYEPWMKDVSLPASRVVDTTAGIAERLIEIGEEISHSHGPSGEHEHAGTAFTTWLDLSLLAVQAQAVADAFARTWPEQQTSIARRNEDLQRELTALDEAFLTAGERLAGSAFVFSHPVYQYLEARYGLRGPALHWEPDMVPTEADWDAFGELTSMHSPRWMIWEADPLPATKARLREAGVGILVIEPGARRPVTGDMLDLMRGNLATLGQAN